MSEKKVCPDYSSDLNKSEGKRNCFKIDAEKSKNLSCEAAEHLLRALQSHQRELEIQNEELERTREELEASRSRYSNLYDLAPAGYLTLNENGLILEANLTTAGLLGEERNILINQSITSFILPEHQNIYYKYSKQLLELNAPHDCELKMFHKNMHPFWAKLVSIMVKARDDVVFYYTLIMDITESKLIEDTQLFLLKSGNPKNKENFFMMLARYLAGCLSMEYVCIDKLTGDQLSAETIAVYCDGKFEDNVIYSLNNTPCGKAVGKTVCCFPEDVRNMFPEDVVLQQMRAESYIGVTLWSSAGKPIGLIAVISRKPLKNQSLAESILKLAAIRASGEIEQIQAEEKIASLAKFPEEDPNPVLRIAGDGSLLFSNTAAVRLLNFFNGVSGTEVPELWRIMAEKVFSEQTEHVFEWEFSGRVYAIDVIPIREYSYVNMYARDITERKRALDSLKRSEARYKMISEGFTDYLYTVFVKNGKPVEAFHEESCLAITGYSAREFAEDPNLWMNIVYPDDKNLIVSRLKKLLEGNALPPIEYRIIRKDGNIRWFKNTEIPIYNPNGELISYEGVIKDITEHKQAEELLKQSNEDLERRVAERTRELSITQDATISSMAILAEFRDPETGAHIQRTKFYVKLMLEKLAHYINYYPNAIELIWHSASLHDIGKVAIPDSILLKESNLTMDEFNQMKKHTIHGFNTICQTETILGKNSFLNFAKDITLYHHEKWNGKGYPHGLMGEKIPLPARIMAIADVYDALVSRRPYKKPFSHEIAVKIILNCSGNDFDPLLVKIFAENHLLFNKIAEQYTDIQTHPSDIDSIKFL